MTLDYDPSYEMYCHEIEIQHYMESEEFLNEINILLQDIRVTELEQLI